MTKERIQTLHPQPGKVGRNIERQTYDLIRTAILDFLAAQPGMTFIELMETLERDLAGRIKGSISWFGVTVKLDMEARGLIERIPDSSPQRLRLKQG